MINTTYTNPNIPFSTDHQIDYQEAKDKLCTFLQENWMDHCHKSGQFNGENKKKAEDYANQLTKKIEFVVLQEFPFLIKRKEQFPTQFDDRFKDALECNPFSLDDPNQEPVYLLPLANYGAVTRATAAKLYSRSNPRHPATNKPLEKEVLPAHDIKLELIKLQIKATEQIKKYMLGGPAVLTYAKSQTRPLSNNTTMILGHLASEIMSDFKEISASKKITLDNPKLAVRTLDMVKVAFKIQGLKVLKEYFEYLIQASNKNLPNKKLCRDLRKESVDESNVQSKEEWSNFPFCQKEGFALLQEHREIVDLTISDLYYQLTGKDLMKEDFSQRITKKKSPFND